MRLLIFISLLLTNNLAYAIKCSFAQTQPKFDASYSSGNLLKYGDKASFSMEGCAKLMMCKVTYWFDAKLYGNVSVSSKSLLSHLNKDDFNVTAKWQTFTTSASFDTSTLDLDIFPGAFTSNGIAMQLDLSGEQPKCNKDPIMAGDKSFSFTLLNKAYNLKGLDSHYQGENLACVWQQTQGERCPPFVTYLSDQLRDVLGLEVRKGKLFNTENLAFDTRYADIAFTSTKVAIFVMGEYGKVYASNAHKVYMFHHSSINAGRDVASAGEIQVTNGHINSITSCSGHYRPSDPIAMQVIDSFKRQGYKQKIPFKSCTPLDIDYLMDTTANKPPPVELVFNEEYSVLLGPGEAEICYEGNEHLCKTAQKIIVPESTTVELCDGDNNCVFHDVGEHIVSVTNLHHAIVTMHDYVVPRQ